MPPAAFLPVDPVPPQANPAKTTVLTVLGMIFCLLVFGANYLRALHWAGIMNPQSAGYMMGGCLGTLFVGFLLTLLLDKIRGKKSIPPVRFFSISTIAFLISLVSLEGSLNTPSSRIDSGTKQELGDLLRQAAGKKPKTADAHWWDAPSRDFFQDIIGMNQRYISEVRNLDNSAIQNLYSTDSYAGKTHMEKVIAQLQAASDVDAKYSSMDPILKKMKDRVTSIDAPESEKTGFLDGFDQSVAHALEPRNALLRVAKEWMDASVRLYEFMLANSDHYSIRDAKLYFDSKPLSDEFVERQSKAISLHKDFLKTKANFENNRNNNLNQMGVSPSEFAPSQLGKTH